MLMLLNSQHPRSQAHVIEVTWLLSGDLTFLSSPIGFERAANWEHRGPQYICLIWRHRRCDPTAVLRSSLSRA